MNSGKAADVVRGSKNPRRTALGIIVNAMCRAGHMNGWCGDVSAAFQKEQRQILEESEPHDRRDWLERNRSNLLWRCDVPESVIAAAH